MDFILKLMIAFGVLITTSNAVCDTIKPRLRTPWEKPKGCWYEDELHAFDTQWDSEACDICRCTRQGLECCGSHKAAVGFNKKMCDAHWVQENCTFNVVRKKNPLIKCPFKLVELNSDSTDSSDSNSQDKSHDQLSLKSLEELDKLYANEHIDDYGYINEEEEDLNDYPEIEEKASEEKIKHEERQEVNNAEKDIKKVEDEYIGVNQEC